MTPEKIIQNAIVNYLNQRKKEGLPVYVERRNAGGFSYRKGIADLYAVVDGIHIEIEVKREGGHLETMQEKWRDQCHKLNITWLCADSVFDVKAVIDPILRQGGYIE